jgi:hypothetical protein
LGGTVYEDDDFHSVIVDGKWRFGVQFAPNRVPPGWPDGPLQQQVHLDLHVEDIRAAHEHAISLGAGCSRQPTTLTPRRAIRSTPIPPGTRSVWAGTETCLPNTTSARRRAKPFRASRRRSNAQVGSPHDRA